MENKNQKIEGKAVNSQVDAGKLARRKWCPCIVIVAVVFVFMIVGAIIALRSNSGSNKKDNSPVTTPVADPVPEPAANSSSTKSSSKKSSTNTATDTSAADKEKMINFFVGTAVSDSTGRELYIIRWDKPAVSAGVAVGVFDDVLNGCLDGFINDFNQLTNNVDLFHDNTVDLGIPNIKIFYLDEATFNERARGVSPYGYVEWDLKDDYSINRISMNISQKVKEMDQAVQCQIIRHEMMHAVGFWGHSDVYPESIMSLPKSNYVYPVEDKRLIQLLYNIGLPLGHNPAATREYLNANYPF